MARALIACEFSARLRDALREMGHDAYSCDLESCLGDPRWHFEGDVTPYLDDDWDLLVCFPPCTYITNAAVHLLGRVRGRIKAMREGARFFRRCLESKSKRVGCENPVMCGQAQKIVGRNWDQLVHPWQFGDAYAKRTDLWLRNLPPLRPTKIVAPSKDVIVNMGADPRNVRYRQKMRSITPPGMARAMAQQWGGLL